VLALAKPNYLLAFLPCFGPALWFRLVQQARAGGANLGAVLAGSLLAFGPIVAVLAAQFGSTYARASESDSGIVVLPLKVWSQYSPNIPASILLGIAFPLTVSACYPRAVLRDRGVLLAWAVLGVAVLQFALLAESGPRLFVGNFGWGAHAADSVLFLACCGLLLRQRRDPRYWVSASVFALHVGAGVFYLGRFLSDPGSGWM
jgi:hypothetical protein